MRKWLTSLGTAYAGAIPDSAYLQELVELAQLMALRPQLGDLLHRVGDDGQLVGAHRLARIQQLRQLRETAASTLKDVSGLSWVQVYAWTTQLSQHDQAAAPCC